MRYKSVPRTPCQTCGEPLRRVPRKPDEAIVRGSRRYACTSSACGWQGLLPRMSSRRFGAWRRWVRNLWPVWRPQAARRFKNLVLPLAVCGMAILGGLGFAGWQVFKPRHTHPSAALQLSVIPQAAALSLQARP